MPDRIEAGTFLVAAAVTGGRLRLENATCDHVRALVEAFERVGVPVACAATTIEIDATGLRPGDLRACDIATAPYPGLATDLQPPTCVLLTQASGTSRVHEAVFEDRVEWLAELTKLGARIDIEDAHHASIHGPARSPRRRGLDQRPAGRCLPDPRGPRGRRCVTDPRRAPRPAGV